jgi:hypothetical protein
MSSLDLVLPDGMDFVRPAGWETWALPRKTHHLQQEVALWKRQRRALDHAALTVTQAENKRRRLADEALAKRANRLLDVACDLEEDEPQQPDAGLATTLEQLRAELRLAEQAGGVFWARKIMGVIKGCFRRDPEPRRRTPACVPRGTQPAKR